MTDESAPAVSGQPSAHKDRRVGLIIFGIVEVLIGLGWFGLLVLTLAILPTLVAKPGQPQLPPGMLAAVPLIYGAIGVFFIVVGVGSMFAQRWARIAMLAVSWFWLGCGLMAMVVLSITVPITARSMPPPAGSAAAMPSIGAILAFILIICGFFYVILPGIFLLFYHSKHVKATCAATVSGPIVSSPRPLAVAIISWFFFISTIVSLPIVLMMQQPMPVFGTFIRNWEAHAYYLVWTLTFLYFTWEFYQLRVRGWWAILIMVFYGPLSSVVTIAHVGWDEFVRATGLTNTAMQAPNATAILPVILAVMLAWPFVLATILLFVRKDFTAAGLA